MRAEDDRKGVGPQNSVSTEFPALDRPRRSCRKSLFFFDLQSGRLDLNQRPLGPEQSGNTSQVPEKQAIAGAAANACTPACTTGAINEQTGNVVALAAALLALSPSDRARLAALLLEPAQQKDSTEAPHTSPRIDLKPKGEAFFHRSAEDVSALDRAFARLRSRSYPQLTCLS
jgi:hypothetical protein